MNKSIVFLLPAGSSKPSGGFKVAFEYANRLASDGYKVSIVYPNSLFLSTTHLKTKIRALIRYIYYIITRKYKADQWFALDKKIEQLYVWDLSENLVPQADIYVATAVKTAGYLQEYKRQSKKLYLIQSFEDWSWDKEKVISTYHAPFQKIVIAGWLMKIMEENNETATLIQNGFDFDYFQKQIDYKDKNKLIITMLYHKSLLKGCEDGFRAFDIIKAKYPELLVNLFGVPSRPKFLPEWYRYYKQPCKEIHNKIYNEAAIFVGPSHIEGFCLTPPEAMQCGCAVACTDIGGYRDVCIDNETALLSPPKDWKALAHNIIRLIEDDALRYRIAKNGHEYIQNFTWERAYNKFRELIVQQ
ncbi:MAG: glycosyltransferase family 4 protein [Dysgonamonadaceae bacterium]|jgi:glycosyltransferase involved in cell wall biosynthesis|nr:glycosyltransferase family 4 protein [Dysgonamonadaceae bacterium]